MYYFTHTNITYNQKASNKIHVCLNLRQYPCILYVTILEEEAYMRKIDETSTYLLSLKSKGTSQ